LLIVRRGVDMEMNTHSKWPTVKDDNAVGSVEMPPKSFLACVALWLKRGICGLLNEPRPNIRATRQLSPAHLVQSQPPVATSISAAAFPARGASKPTAALSTPDYIATAVTDPILKEFLLKIEQIGGYNRGFINANLNAAPQHPSAADDPEPHGVGTAR